MPDKHSYHIVLASGEERDVKGDDAGVIDGWLVIKNANESAVVMYAPGAVVCCELERRDDHG